MNLPLRHQTHDHDTSIDTGRIIAALKAARHVPEVQHQQQPMYNHTRARKTSARYRARMPMVLRGDDGALMLIDDERRESDRPLSENIQRSFLATVERESRRWHNIDRADLFAEGALAFALFRGAGHTALQLRKVPGVMPWSVLKRERIGVIERSTRGLRGERYRLSPLGGDSAPR